MIRKNVNINKIGIRIDIKKKGKVISVSYICIYNRIFAEMLSNKTRSRSGLKFKIIRKRRAYLTDPTDPTYPTYLTYPIQIVNWSWSAMQIS